MTPDPDPRVDVLVISGAAGVGKSTTAIEASLQLQAAGVAHALIDTDELDRIYPVPEDLARVTERNLACVWQGLRERGATRLILCGVYLDTPMEFEWAERAVPGARFLLARLRASEGTIMRRIDTREIGSGRDAQAVRTRRQLADLAGARRPDVHEVETDGRAVADVAAEILALAGWVDQT